MPRLNTRPSPRRRCRRARWISPKIRGHVPRRPVDHGVDGARGAPAARLPGRPPPVMWATPCTSTARRERPRSPARRSPTDAAARRRASACAPVQAGSSRRRPADVEQHRAGERVAVASAGPGDGRPMSTSPGAARASPVITRSRSTTPTAKPTRSNSPGSIAPGCSAISPPISAQPAWPAAVGDARDELLDLVGVELADRDVVEEEQRLGALAHDVVDAHRDEVDADGVEAAGRPGRSAPWCRRRRSTTRAPGAS